MSASGAAPDIAPLVKVVELAAVRLTRLEVDAPADELVEATLKVDAEHRTQIEGEGLVDGKFRLSVFFRLSLAPPLADVPDEESTSESPVQIDARYTLTYKTPKGAQFSDDVLAEFGRINGVFNAWPFWRELVHTAFCRMGLPPFTVPLYRLPKRRTQPAQEKPAPKRRARAEA